MMKIDSVNMWKSRSLVQKKKLNITGLSSRWFTFYLLQN